MPVTPAAQSEKPIIKEYVYGNHITPKPVIMTVMWTMFAPHYYIVVSITNSTWYKPGDKLDESVVKQICDDQRLANWQVNVLSDDIIGQITGTISGIAGVATGAGGALSAVRL